MRIQKNQHPAIFSNQSFTSKLLTTLFTPPAYLYSNPYRIDKTNQRIPQEKSCSIRYAVAHGRHTRQIRPTRYQNAFRHGLAGIAQRRADGVLNPQEQSIREEILSGLLTDKGRATQISTATRVLAEISASDVLLGHVYRAIDGVIQNNPRARANPKALAELDRSEGPLVSSL